MNELDDNLLATPEDAETLLLEMGFEHHKILILLRIGEGANLQELIDMMDPDNHNMVSGGNPYMCALCDLPDHLHMISDDGDIYEGELE